MKWRPRFSIANLILLTVIVALCLAWWQEKRQTTKTLAELQRARWYEKLRADANEQLKANLKELRSYATVGHFLTNEGRFEEALPVFEVTLSRLHRSLGDDHQRTKNVAFYVGDLNNLLGNHDVAEPYLEEFISYARQVPGGMAQYASALSHLAEIRRRQGRFIETEELLRECVAIRDQNHWTAHDSKSRLGECLVDQRKFVEAEPILIAGFEGLLVREEKIWDVLRPSRMTNAAQRLVTLYENWDKPKEATKWRKELERVELKYGASR